MDTYEFDFSGKTVFVSGGSRGIGKGVAEAFASKGARVAIGSLHEKKAEEVAGTIRDGFDTDCFAVGLDVGSPSSVADAFARIRQRFGHLDIAVNNAGIASGVDFLEIDEKTWDRVLDVNLKGVYNCCQQEIPLMGRGGAIVNIGSISASIVNFPQLQAHYNTSKAGVIMLTKALAAEFASRKIRVNAVSPGYTLTDMNRRAEIQDMIDTWKERTPMGRLAEVEEICGAVLFLSSHLASFITGHDLLVDGGYTIW